MKSYQDITHSEFIDSYCYESRKDRDSAWHAAIDARKAWESARATYDSAHATYDAACDILVNPIDKNTPSRKTP